MVRLGRILATGAVLGVVLAAAPSVSEAAWWKPWGKKDTQPPAPAPEPAPLPEAPPAAGGDGTVIAPELTDAQRFDRLEAEMRTLTGQVEQLTFQMQQIQAELQRLEGGGGPDGAAKKVGRAAGRGAASDDGGGSRRRHPRPLRHRLPRRRRRVRIIPGVDPGANPGPVAPDPVGALAAGGAEPIDLTPGTAAAAAAPRRCRAAAGAGRHGA